MNRGFPFNGVFFLDHFKYITLKKLALSYHLRKLNIFAIICATQ